MTVIYMLPTQPTLVIHLSPLGQQVGRKSNRPLQRPIRDAWYFRERIPHYHAARSVRLGTLRSSNHTFILYLPVITWRPYRDASNHFLY
ncbi:MAG: hypothetical protein KF746_16000 [Chitinophagaceae bacterium]|nr:hypothetical protein [Chitinophagaceae bacterium]